MQTVLISLPTAQIVQDFVQTLTGLEGNFDLISGKYILDARSLMGIFTLDLTQPLTLRVYNDTPETLVAIQKFLANTQGGGNG